MPPHSEMQESVTAAAAATAASSPSSSSLSSFVGCKECARCGTLKTSDEISEVRVRVGGGGRGIAGGGGVGGNNNAFAGVFHICRGCKRREQSAPLSLGYECPGWKYGREGYRCPRLAFSDVLPPLGSLAGRYDIIFYAADQVFGPRYHRATRGTLILSSSVDVVNDVVVGISAGGGGGNDDYHSRDTELRHHHNGPGGSLEAAMTGEAAAAAAAAGGGDSPSPPVATKMSTIVCGFVEMDRTMAISDTPWIDSFRFVLRGGGDDDDGNGGDNSGGAAAKLTSFEETGEFWPYRGGGGGWGSSTPSSSSSSSFSLRGQMRLVSERAAVRSRPDARGGSMTTRGGAADLRGGGGDGDADGVDDDQSRQWRRRHLWRRQGLGRHGLLRPITFRDVGDADAIMDRYTASITSWITRNLCLPDLVASKVCEFWCARPPPLFFFEKGDLCLTTVWPRRGYMYDDVVTMIVARRRMF